MISIQLQIEGRELFRAWTEPSEEEHEEDVREDERNAEGEAMGDTHLISSTALMRPFDRPCPMVICVSRDVPDAAAQYILRKLNETLPGFAVHIDTEVGMGLHVPDLQRLLAARCEWWSAKISVRKTNLVPSTTISILPYGGGPPT